MSVTKFTYSFNPYPLRAYKILGTALDTGATMHTRSSLTTGIKYKNNHRQIARGIKMAKFPVSQEDKYEQFPSQAQEKPSILLPEYLTEGIERHESPS